MEPLVIVAVYLGLVALGTYLSVQFWRVCAEILDLEYSTVARGYTAEDMWDDLPLCVMSSLNPLWWAVVGLWLAMKVGERNRMQRRIAKPTKEGAQG